MFEFVCDVWHKGIGWDAYWVRADSLSDAEAECSRRLQEETDDPDDWVIEKITPIPKDEETNIDFE